MSPSRAFVPFVFVFGLMYHNEAAAQVPPGWVVVATTTRGQVQAPWGNLAGLWLADPRRPGAMIEIVGLPASLTTPPIAWPYEYGCGGVTIHAESGDLLVGDVADAGAPQNLYRIRITPAPTTPPTYAATVVSTHFLGTAAAGVGGLVSHVACRDAKRVVVTCSNVAAGPLGAGPMRVGEVDLSTGVVTAWPAVSNTFSGSAEGRAVCIDDSRANVYFAGRSGGVGPSTIRKVPLPALGVPTTTNVLTSALPLQAFTMRWDRAQQRLVVSGRENTSNGGAMWEVDPVTGVALAVGPDGPANIASFDIEPTTGDVLFAGIPSTGVPGLHHYVRGTSNGTWLGNSAAVGPIGLPFGCAVAPSPTPYGLASVEGTGPLVTWAPASSAGLPTLGNSAYSLRLDPGSGGSLLAGHLLATAQPLSPGVLIPGLGLTLNVDPTQPVVELGFASATIPLPIPNDALLVGYDVFLQVATITSFAGLGPVLGASEGAWLRIL